MPIICQLMTDEGGGGGTHSHLCLAIFGALHDFQRQMDLSHTQSQALPQTPLCSKSQISFDAAETPVGTLLEFISTNKAPCAFRKEPHQLLTHHFATEVALETQALIMSP